VQAHERRDDRLPDDHRSSEQEWRQAPYRGPTVRRRSDSRAPSSEPRGRAEERPQGTRQPAERPRTPRNAHTFSGDLPDPTFNFILNNGTHGWAYSREGAQVVKARENTAGLDDTDRDVFLNGFIPLNMNKRTAYGKLGWKFNPNKPPGSDHRLRAWWRDQGEGYTPSLSLKFHPRAGHPETDFRYVNLANLLPHKAGSELVRLLDRASKGEVSWGSYYELELALAREQSAPAKGPERRQ
jgi:hypothetical protein